MELGSGYVGLSVLQYRALADSSFCEDAAEIDCADLGGWLSINRGTSIDTNIFSFWDSPKRGP